MTATGLNKDEFEIISEKITYRLAQRPGSYVVTKYVRPVLKLRESGKLVSIPAPEGVIKGSRADVSFQAGIVVDKFAYHQPLYRIHRKLTLTPNTLNLLCALFPEPEKLAFLLD